MLFWSGNLYAADSVCNLHQYSTAADATELASLGRVDAENWVEVDVTALITGDGAYSLQITAPVGNEAAYASKEGVRPPQLVITLADAPTATASPTYTPTDTETPTPVETPTASQTATPEASATATIEATPKSEKIPSGKTLQLLTATTATFLYDGDGGRVKSTINGTTTSFVGSHYEVTGSTVTKYYFAKT